MQPTCLIFFVSACIHFYRWHKSQNDSFIKSCASVFHTMREVVLVCAHFSVPDLRARSLGTKSVGGQFGVVAGHAKFCCASLSSRFKGFTLPIKNSTYALSSE